MTTEKNDPLETARSHIALAATFLKLDPAQTRALHDAHEVAMRRSPDGGLAYVNDEPDTPSWLRSIEASQPALLGKGKPAAAKPATSYATSGLTDLFVGMKRGDAGAQAEIERRARVGDGTPAQGAPARPAHDADTLTSLMIRARAGDTAALEALTRNAR